MSALLIWLLGAMLLMVCFFLHGVGLVLTARILFSETIQLQRTRPLFVSMMIFTLAAFGMVVLHTAEAGIWASAYLELGAIDDGEAALAFSIGAFTTYGDPSFTIDKRWILLAEMQSLNGLLVFGMTTAFLFSAATRLHRA